MGAYEQAVQCEYPGCPARYQYQLEIYERWFKFCLHHSNELLELAGMPRRDELNF